VKRWWPFIASVKHVANQKWQPRNSCNDVNISRRDFKLSYRSKKKAEKQGNSCERREIPYTLVEIESLIQSI